MLDRLHMTFPLVFTKALCRQTQVQVGADLCSKTDPIFLAFCLGTPFGDGATTLGKGILPQAWKQGRGLDH